MNPKPERLIDAKGARARAGGVGGGRAAMYGQLVAACAGTDGDELLLLLLSVALPDAAGWAVAAVGCAAAA